MREIFFRARTISEDEYMDSGEWVEGFYTCFNGDEHRIYTGYAETDCGDYYPDWFNVIPETLGQYTGLTANGTKIFEGDIVKAQDEILGSPFCYGITGKVVYDECAFFLEPKNPIDSLRLYDECAVYEIIGNIYDNPELLEAQDDGSRKD